MNTVIVRCATGNSKAVSTLVKQWLRNHRDVTLSAEGESEKQATPFLVLDCEGDHVPLWLAGKLEQSELVVDFYLIENGDDEEEEQS